MESDKQIRSSVIARSMRFNGLFRPLHQEKIIEKQSQRIQNLSSISSSGFKVIPTKELCRVYLQKPDLLASKGIIDAQSTPPHQKKGMKSKNHGEIANHRKFGRRFDQQNVKLKLRHHHTSVDHLKSKTGKKVNSPRSFSPLGFGIDSQLRDRKKGQYFTILEQKPNERKKLCDRAVTPVREVGSKLMVSTCRDSSLSFERDRVAAADVKFRDMTCSGFISKDDNKDSSDCVSNASPSGCQTNSEEAHQPSPVSVLEPMFDDDSLDDCEEVPHLDLHGLEKQIDTLKSESESYSDGSGMEVSSDDEESVIDEAKESEESEPIVFLDTQESRDSSYVDDILAEVLLGDKNWDFVITPKIFEKLEKKYYTETSWKRSERRILFDRVNSALVEILESFTATPTWKKPVSRRLGIVLSTNGLKQELWKVLARQEKRAKKESFAKVPVIDIDDWLELESDDESVVCELESLIVDELLDEVVSFM
ncbi:unnamed protein product [Microthlaspi erraticum]|uniref:DUF4378 domain-containing protein n=1 Tax=Microthlaspi erraticum TaxID=1685480 RepID=A0A6D2IVE6_9BRAS|nr:unnamed protein product [Microthlaspi erraticum]